MKAESNDFRQKILETNWKELESIQQTADRFLVSYSFVSWAVSGKPEASHLNRYGEIGKSEPQAPWRRSQTKGEPYLG